MYLFGAKCISRLGEVMYFFKLSIYPKEKTQRCLGRLVADSDVGIYEPCTENFHLLCNMRQDSEQWGYDRISTLLLRGMENKVCDIVV